jgi:hypothetical protein
MDKVLITTKVGSSIIKQIIKIEKVNSTEFKKKEKNSKIKKQKLLPKKIF